VSAPHAIRIVGDPVLRQRADEVTDIDARLVRLVDDMFTTMYDAPGVGLAAPQVGVQKRFFIYDLDHGDGQQVLINPVVEESDGEWEFTEGCLSIPGLHFDIVRPRRIHVTGVDLEGREVSLEADDYLARVIQHELDHLDGVLMLERLDEDQRKAARRAVRQLQLEAAEPDPSPRGRFPFGRS
jgi:peptide deformylase